MNCIPISLLALVLGSATTVAQTLPTPVPPIIATTAPTVATATITLGSPFSSVVPGVIVQSDLPTAPYTFRRGTRLQIVAPTPGLAHPVATWSKDGQPLAVTSTTLDLGVTTTADSGRYAVTVRDGDSIFTQVFDSAVVLITDRGQGLLNQSTRAEINPSQPSVVSGFVVQPGPGQSAFIIRAVGPALSMFGVGHPLATPQLRVRDSNGNEVQPRLPMTTPIFTHLPWAWLAAIAGAFPLPEDGKDIERLYVLSPGAYTAEVSSADGGSGTVLFEVYSVPL